jgi:hypothetical protein
MNNKSKITETVMAGAMRGEKLRSIAAEAGVSITSAWLITRRIGLSRPYITESERNKVAVTRAIYNLAAAAK